MQKWVTGFALATVSVFGFGTAAQAEETTKTEGRLEDACADIAVQRPALEDVLHRIDACAERLSIIEPQRTKRRTYFSVASSGSGLIALIGGASLSPGTTTALTTLGLLPIFADNRFNNAAQAQVQSAVANQLNFVTHHANEAAGRAQLLEARSDAIEVANGDLLKSVAALRDYTAKIPVPAANATAEAQKERAERLAALQTAISIADNASSRADEARALLLARVAHHETLAAPIAVRLYDEARSQGIAALARIEPTPAQSLSGIVSAPLSALTSVFRTGADVPANLLLSSSAQGVAVSVKASDLDIPAINIDVPSTTFNRANLTPDDMAKLDELAVAARKVALELRVTQELQK